MLVASSTIENTQEKVRFFQDLEANTQARLSAESAAETGILKLNTVGGIGYELSRNDIFCPEIDGAEGDECKTAGDYEIFSTAAKNDATMDSYYYTPMPGTGTAPPIEMCSILDEHLDPDHSCNWNKIIQGQGVRTPLFTTVNASNPDQLAADSNDDGILDPTELGLNNFKLLVRTPCENGSFGAVCEIDDVLAENDRYRLDAGGPILSDLYSVNTDDSVILWQIVGEDSSLEEPITLLPNTSIEDVGLDQYRPSDSNTEITESMINAAYDLENYVVFQAGGSGTPFDKIYNMAKNLFTYHSYEWESLYLEFTIGAPLIAGSGASIPYLEWQLITNSLDGPFADTKAVLVGEGTYATESGTTYYYPYVITRELTGELNSIYTLSN